MKKRNLTLILSIFGLIILGILIAVIVNIVNGYDFAAMFTSRLAITCYIAIGIYILIVIYIIIKDYIRRY